MPKKTKKGGGGKGGVKTEEERLLTQQKTAQAAEENAKKKEEVFTLFLKDKLQKEERNTEVNLLKLNEGWRSILRQIRSDDLREDIEVFSQTFERQIDSTDSTIKNLERDLQRADDQSAEVRRVHLQRMEHLQAQQDKRLMFVQQRWESGLQHLNSRFLSERKQMSENSEQRRAELEDATFVVEQRHKTVMDETHRLHRDIITSSECAYIDMKAKLNEVDRETLMENWESQMLRRRESKELDEMQEENQQFIQQMDAEMKRVERLQDLVFKLRVRMNSSTTEQQLREQDLTDNQNQVNQKTRELREQLIRSQRAARKQLTALSVQSDKAAKKLQAVIAKGERVLRVSEMCRKLESKLETASLPLFSTEEHRPETTGLEIEEPETEVSGFPELQQLMLSLNTAVLQREALKQHKDDLSTENQQLRLLLRQRLDAMTVSDDTLAGPHALLTVIPAPTAAPTHTNRRNAVMMVVQVNHTM